VSFPLLIIIGAKRVSSELILIHVLGDNFAVAGQAPVAAPMLDFGLGATSGSDRSCRSWTRSHHSPPDLHLRRRAHGEGYNNERCHRPRSPR
jgi:hypothetical protein